MSNLKKGFDLLVSQDSESQNFVTVRRDFPLQPEHSYHFAPLGSVIYPVAGPQEIPVDQYQIVKAANSWFQNGDTHRLHERKQTDAYPVNYNPSFVERSRSEGCLSYASSPTSKASEVEMMKKRSPDTVTAPASKRPCGDFSRLYNGVVENLKAEDLSVPGAVRNNSLNSRTELKNPEHLKEQLLQAISSIEEQIAEVECHRNNLSKELSLKTEALSVNGEVALDYTITGLAQTSIAQKIYAENKVKAQMSHAALDKFGFSYELPIYNQPADTAVYHENRQKFLKFRKKLQHYLRRKLREKSIRENYLTSIYSQLTQQWLEELEKKDTENAGDMKQREFFEKQFPELKKQREEKQKFSRAVHRIRSEAELEEIMDGLQEQEVETQRMRNCSVIPPIFIKPVGKISFIDKNRLIEDPVSEYRSRLSILNLWTPQEKECFWEKFLLFPKNFGAIASFLAMKTAADCVHFYYLSKKSVGYKQLIKASLKRKRTVLRPPDHPYMHRHLQLLPGRQYERNTLLCFESSNTSQSATLSDNGNDKQVLDYSQSEKEVSERQIERVELENISASSFQQGNRKVEPCALCGEEPDDVIHCRPVTKSNYTFYGLSEQSVGANQWVCLPCHFKISKRKYVYCPIPTCRRFQHRVRKLHCFPPIWDQMNTELKRSAHEIFQIPADVTECCSSCLRRIICFLEENQALPDLMDWSKEEIGQMKALIAEYGVNWKAISTHLATKTEEQCSDLYYYHRFRLGLRDIVHSTRQHHGCTGDCSDSCEEDNVNSEDISRLRSVQHNSRDTVTPPVGSSSPQKPSTESDCSSHFQASSTVISNPPSSTSGQSLTCVRDLIYQAIEFSLQKPNEANNNKRSQSPTFAKLADENGNHQNSVLVSRNHASESLIVPHHQNEEPQVHDLSIRDKPSYVQHQQLAHERGQPFSTIVSPGHSAGLHYSGSQYVPPVHSAVYMASSEAQKTSLRAPERFQTASPYQAATSLLGSKAERSNSGFTPENMNCQPYSLSSSQSQIIADFVTSKEMSEKSLDCVSPYAEMRKPVSTVHSNISDTSGALAEHQSNAVGISFNPKDSETRSSPMSYNRSYVTTNPLCPPVLLLNKEKEDTPQCSSKNSDHHFEDESGVMQNEASQLFQQSFQKDRPRKPGFTTASIIDAVVTHQINNTDKSLKLLWPSGEHDSLSDHINSIIAKSYYSNKSTSPGERQSSPLRLPSSSSARPLSSPVESTSVTKTSVMSEKRHLSYSPENVSSPAKAPTPQSSQTVNPLFPWLSNSNCSMSPLDYVKHKIVEVMRTADDESKNVSTSEKDDAVIQPRPTSETSESPFALHMTVSDMPVPAEAALNSPPSKTDNL